MMLLFTAAVVFADSGDNFANPVYDPEFIAQQERMLANIEQSFTRLLYRETFDVTSKPAISKPADGYYVSERITRLSRQDITLAAYKPLQYGAEHSEDFFNLTGSYPEFYVAMDAQMIERSDTGNDCFFIRYTNAGIVGEAASSGAEIAFPIAVRKFEGAPGNRTYTEYYDLSEYADDYGNNRIEMTRLNGYTSVFINGQFIVGFEDGLSGRFYQVFGSELGSGQGYVTAEFDNFLLRTTWN